MSLWDNIRKRRKAGKPKLKPGDKNYPKTLDIEGTHGPEGIGKAYPDSGEKFSKKKIKLSKHVAKDLATAKLGEDAPATNTGSIPNPAQTAMGPKFTPMNVMDRRKKKRPDVLRRFKTYLSDAER